MIITATLGWLDLSCNHWDKLRSVFMPQWRGVQFVVWGLSFHLTTHPVKRWKRFKESILHTVVSVSSVLPHVAQVFIYDTKNGHCCCLRPVNILMIFFISGSSLKTKDLDVTVTEPSAWTRTHAEAFFFPTMLLEHRHAQKPCQRTQNLALNRCLCVRCVYMY